MRRTVLAACVALAGSCIAPVAPAQNQTFTPPTIKIQPPLPPPTFHPPTPPAPPALKLPNGAQGAAKPAAPPVAATAPPAQHTPSPLAKAEGGMCLALTHPPPGKDENDPALVCDCARAFGKQLIAEAEALVADIDKHGDDLAAVGANVLEAEGVRELRAKVAKDHETLAGLKTLWSHPDDQCHAWDARAQLKPSPGPEQATYMARGAKSFSYNAVQSSVTLFWSFILDDTAIQMSRIFVNDDIAFRAEVKEFDDHRELCPEWTRAADTRLQTSAAGMLDAAAEVRRTYSRFKPELLLWNAFAGRDGWPSAQYPHTTGSLPPSFLEFSEPVPMDLAYHPDGKINNGDKDYAVKLHYNVFDMAVEGPDRYYCDQWSPGAPSGIEMRVATNKNGDNAAHLSIDPLKPVGDIEFYASGADAAQLP